MARLILLNISMLLLLVAIGGSTAWPYPEEEKKSEATKDDLLQQQETKEVNQALANFNGLIAEINQAGACGCDLTAYDSKNYGGRKLLIRQQNACLSNDYFNDRVESIKIGGSCHWLLYEHDNFDGQSSILKSAGNYPSPSYWGGSGNRISSARALPPRGKKAIVLFQHDNYKGRMLTLYSSNTNLPAIDFNDQLSSFIITGGTWRLYEHTNYQGRHVTLGVGEYSASALGGAGGNDKISSAKLLY